MTACTNNGGKARRVVTAALVGALSVGAVPAIALATGTGDGIQILAADWYTGVKVTKATDGKGKTLTGDLTKVTIEAGKGKYLAPTEISNGFVTTKVNTNDYVFVYSTNADGTGQVASSNGKTTTGYTKDLPADYFNTAAAGTYYLTIYKKVAGTDNADVTQKTDSIAFVLAKSEAAQGVHVDGTLVYKKAPFAQSDFKFVDANGSEVKVSGGIVVYDAVNGTQVTPQNAGDYYAKFTGTDGHSYSVPFTIEKLDLSTASLSVGDQSATTPITTDAQLFAALSINNNARLAASLGDALKVTKVVDPNMTGALNSGAGEYTVTIAAETDSDASDYDANVTGTGTVTYSVLNSSIFDDTDTEFKYGREDLSKSAPYSSVTISLVDGESFDATKVTVEYDGEKLAADNIELSYQVKDGTSWKACEASDLAEQGEYQVTVRVKPFTPFGSSDVLGGTASFTVKVTGTEVDQDSNLGFYVDGELVGDEAHITYDGSDQLEKVSVVVKDEDGNDLVEGTDYELKVTLDGEEVDSAVDASSHAYEIEVVPLTFTFNGRTPYTLDLYVDQVEIDRLVADVADMKFAADEKTGEIPEDGTDADGTNVDNEFYVKYTGSAVEVPGVKYQVEKGGEYSYVTLDPSLYNVVSVEQGSKEVEEAVEKGTYTVTIALSDEAKSNYSLDVDEFAFTIRAYGHFTDVASDAWYATSVEQAWANYYVNGLAGTDLYAPNAQITRADVACILFNMAGGNIENGKPTVGDEEFSFSDVDGYVTGFDDVDGHAYYAKAIAWAKASGVVNGHDGNFRPDDKVTREEFACMLANFAKVKGDFVAPAEGALDSMPDASSVSSWAEESVAWAVENGVMGNGGSVNASAQISRAEVAAMAVNYQPEPIVEITEPRV